MGDLGMHVCHVPLRAGLEAARRPRDADEHHHHAARRQGRHACRATTWDNATLLIETAQPAGGQTFPLTLSTARISPGEKNSWYIEILGTKASARFSTTNPKLLELLDYAGGEQTWRQVQTGQRNRLPVITGPIFEFGFTDAILQMWAAFLHELDTKSLPSSFAGCVRPDEVAISHEIFTAALASHANRSAVALCP